MRDGFRILDADRHVVEPYGFWEEYLEARFRPQAPRALPFFAATGQRASSASAARTRENGASAADLPPMLVVAGKPVCRDMTPGTWLEIARAATARSFLGPLDRPETHLAHMDVEGIDAAVLYPTYGLLVLGVDTLAPDLAAALARAYNRWLRDFVGRSPDRLKGAALVSMHAPGEMPAEVATAAAAGFVAAVVRPNPVDGRRLSDRAYAPFWAECEARGLAVVLHEGTHAYLPTAGADRFASRFAQHACSHPLEQMIGLLDLIEGGVFARHPRLRVGLLEAGAGWAPYWLWRLDEEYAHLHREVAERVREKPSATFQRQAWITAEADEPYLPRLLDFIGASRILFGTDFPHVDHDDGLVARALSRRQAFSDDVMRRYLSGNARRFYGLDAALDDDDADDGADDADAGDRDAGGPGGPEPVSSSNR